MRTPIESLDFYNLELEAPKELERFLEIIKKYRWEYRNFKLDLDSVSIGEMNPAQLVESITILTNLLETILSEFLSIISKLVEENELNKILVEDLENSILNYMVFLKVEIRNLSSLPQERINAFNLSNLGQSLVSPMNSIVMPCLLNSWEVSREEKITYDGGLCKKLKKVTTNCNPLLFYQELYEQTKSRAGSFDRILLVLTSGRISKSSIPLVSKRDEPAESESEKDSVEVIRDVAQSMEKEQREAEIFGDVIEEKLDEDEVP